MLCIVFLFINKKKPTENTTEEEYGTISVDDNTNTEINGMETIPPEDATEYIAELDDKHQTFYDSCEYKFTIADYGTNNVEIDSSLSALAEPCIVDGKDINHVFYSIADALSQNFGNSSTDYVFSGTSYNENSDIILFQFTNKITNNLYDVTYDDTYIYCNEHFSSNE